MDASLKADEVLATVDRPSFRIMIDFLNVSARPETTGPMVEDHLMRSLAIAIQARNVRN